MRIHVFAALILGIMILCTGFTAGEEALRTKHFFWDEITSEHFILIHPVGMINKAREAAFHLEDGFKRITEDLKVEIKAKIPVILYRSKNEFEQNSIFGGSVPESLQAFAETYKNRLVLPVKSSSRDFRYVLQHELTHIIEFGSLFPRRLPSFYIIRFPFYPDWFMEGLAEFYADYNSSYRNMVLRDKALDGRIPPLYKLFGFSHVNRHQVTAAYKQGGEFMRFLCLLDSTFPQKLLASFRDHMPWRIDSIIRAAFNADYITLDKDFRKYLSEKARAEAAGRKELSPLSLISGDNETYYAVYNTDPVWSPDGARVAFISDRDEKATVYLMNSDGTGIRRLFNLRVNFTIEHIRRGKGGGLTWSSDGSRIACVGEWKNTDYLYVYNLETGEFMKYNPGFDEIRDPCFSPDGNRIVLSGILNGISDIFIYDTSSETSRRVTNDDYDDYAPSWKPGSQILVYTSERQGQTDLVTVDMSLEDPRKGEEIITPLLSDEMTASWNAKGDRLVFVSNREGFFDLYVMDVSERTIYKQTSLTGGAFQPQFSPDGAHILFSYFRHGGYSLGMIKTDVSEQTVVKPTVNPSVLNDLTKYAEGKTGEEKGEPFQDKYSWDVLFPLGIVNWGSVGNMFSTSRISGALYPYFTEDGTLINGELMYWNMMSRFDIGTGLVAESSYNFDTEIRKDDFGFVIQTRFPFDAYRYIEGGFIAGRKKEYSGSVAVYEADRVGAFIEAGHDNRIYRGLNALRGQRITAGAEFYPGGDDLEEYTDLYGEFTQSLALAEDMVLEFRLRGDLSTGKDRDLFDIADAVRGYEREIAEGYKMVSAGVEYRFPIHRDGNYSLFGHYLLLKDIRGFLFFDGGAVSADELDTFLDDLTAFDLEFRHSAGAGIQIDMYGLQKALFGIRIGIAAVTDTYDDRVSGFLNLQIQF